MTNYTKGPWEWDEANDRLMCSDGFVIDSEPYEGMWFSRYNEEENAANIRLIAAAPEMYEALEKIEKLLLIYEGWDIAGCRAALAKARGEANNETR